MPKPDKPTTNERARAGEALQLRRSGLAYREISTRLGYRDESGARKAVSRLLDRTEAEGVAELRAVEGDRLDALQAAHWSAALAGDVDSTKVILGVIDRRMKLFGLAAPVAVDVGLSGVEGMTDVEFAEQTAALFARLEISTAVRAELRASGGETGPRLTAASIADGQAPAPEGDRPAVPFHAARRAHSAETGDGGWSNIR